jgi:hypothetical protein
MNGRSDQHSINVVPGQDVSEIVVCLAGAVLTFAARSAVKPVDSIASLLTPLAPDITRGQYLHVFPSHVAAGQVRPSAAQQMTAPLMTQPDKTHRNPFARGHSYVFAQSRSRHHVRGSKRACQGT